MTIRHRIISYLEDRERAAPKDIVQGIGSDADPELVRQTLGRMTKAAILKRVRYGEYVLCPGYERRSASVESDTERLIYSCLVELGGLARIHDIHRAVWGGERRKGDRPYDYGRVQRALRHSARFQQSFGRGVWNLPEGELARHPMPGRWAGLVMGKDSPKDRDAFFRDVGAGFTDARGDIELGAVSGDPEIARLLDQMAVRAPSAEREALRQHERDREGGGETLTIGGYLYWLFEQGEPELHLAATAPLYRECARLFGVDAPALSRAA